MTCEFPVAVRRVANCYTPFTLLYFTLSKTHRELLRLHTRCSSHRRWCQSSQVHRRTQTGARPGCMWRRCDTERSNRYTSRCGSRSAAPSTRSDSDNGIQRRTSPRCRAATILTNRRHCSRRCPRCGTACNRKATRASGSWNRRTSPGTGTCSC